MLRDQCQTETDAFTAPSPPGATSAGEPLEHDVPFVVGYPRAIVFYGDLRAELGVKVGFTLVWIGGILFAANVLINLRERSVAGAAAMQTAG